VRDIQSANTRIDAAAWRRSEHSLDRFRRCASWEVCLLIGRQRGDSGPHVTLYSGPHGRKSQRMLGRRAARRICETKGKLNFQVHSCRGTSARTPVLRADWGLLVDPLLGDGFSADRVRGAENLCSISSRMNVPMQHIALKWSLRLACGRHHDTTAHKAGNMRTGVRGSRSRFIYTRAKTKSD